MVYNNKPLVESNARNSLWLYKIINIRIIDITIAENVFFLFYENLPSQGFIQSTKRKTVDMLLFPILVWYICMKSLQCVVPLVLSEKNVVSLSKTYYIACENIWQAIYLLICCHNFNFQEWGQECTKCAQKFTEFYCIFHE